MSTARSDLYKQLPLNTPFSLHVFPIYACNFKCNYCLHAMSNEELTKKSFKKEIMEFATFTKAIDNLKEFDSKLKAIIFAGHGEPLLHKDICKMVKYAKDADIAHRIEITTNASLLDRKMSDALIHAKLDRLKISIQGTSAQKYKEVSQYTMDYEKFLQNLQYFKEHKEHTEVYIKIIDIALDGKEDENTFRNMFDPVADIVGIEYAIPFIKELDDKVYNKEFDCCKQGNKQHSNICSMPFYLQVIAPNGDILPCCSTDVPISLGNVHKNSLKEIWNSKRTNNFLKLMLADKNKNLVCKDCVVPAFGLQTGDYLDEHKDTLLKIYEERDESCY